MSNVKIAAMDAEDLEVVASYVQDAIIFVKDIDYLAQQKQLNLAINRCHNETDVGKNRSKRSHAGLVFSHVEKMQVQNIDRDNPKKVLSLLDVSFKETELPSGIIELKFANNASIKLEVSCLELHMADLGETWVSDVKPNHSL